MQSDKSIKNLWQKQTAVVISTSSNLHLVLRELLKPYQWSVLEPTDQPSEAIRLILDGSADLIIVDDSQQLPLARSLRLVLSTSEAVLTPVLALVADSQNHPMTILRHFGEPTILRKPLTPSRFAPAFASLIKRWEEPKHLGLRQAAMHLNESANVIALSILVKLTRFPETHYLASIALAHRLRHLGKIKEGERVLTSSLKKNPRHLGIIMVLAEYYMYSAMPNLASRLLDSAYTAFGRTLYLAPDLVQASLLSGDLKTAASYYENLMNNGWFQRYGPAELTKLHFVDGQKADAEHVVDRSTKALKKLRSIWDGPQPTPDSSTAGRLPGANTAGANTAGANQPSEDLAGNTANSDTANSNTASSNTANSNTASSDTNHGNLAEDLPGRQNDESIAVKAANAAVS